jgi:uncharacterized protein (TIGR02598 family)
MPQTLGILAPCVPFKGRGLLSPLYPRSRAGNQAFSLTEVAMAIAVAAFALVSLVSLIPSGLSTFRSSMDTSVSAQIFQRIMSDAYQTDFSELLVQKPVDGASFFYRLPKRYFDDQGNEVEVKAPEAPTSEERRRIVYEANIRGSRPGNLNADQRAGGNARLTTLPSTGARYAPRDLSILTVQVANNPEGRKIEDDAKNPGLWESSDGRGGKVLVFTYSGVVARNGYNIPSE